jgi:hypothetical protein
VSAPSADHGRGVSVDIKEFAEKHRVRTRRDSCGEEIVTGSRKPKDMPPRVAYHCHVYDHGDGTRFGLLLLLNTKQQWTHAKKQLVAAGFTIKQNADTEGTALFNPEDPAQVRLAFKLARINPRRVMSEAQRLSLAKARFKLPRTLAPEGDYAPKTHEEPRA